MRVEVEAFGYAVWVRSYDAVPPDPVRVVLGPAPIGLEGIEVTARGLAGDPMSLSRDAFVVDSVLLRGLPTSDGTPVLLDGVRLFNPFHLGGFVSAVNAEVVERATLLAGSGGDAFPIGSLSGAIDIATRDGSRDRRRIVGGLGLGSARFSVEGPVGESASYLADGRRTYIDGVTRALKEGYTYEGVTREMSMAWGSAAFSAHYRDRLGADGIVDASLGHSRFASDLDRVKYGHNPGRDDRATSEPAYDTLVLGEGVMSETSADLRVTWHAGGAEVTTGTRATRFANRHDYHVTDPYYLDDDILGFFAPLSLRESRWRLAAWASAEVPLGRGFSTR